MRESGLYDSRRVTHATIASTTSGAQGRALMGDALTDFDNGTLLSPYEMLLLNPHNITLCSAEYIQEHCPDIQFHSGDVYSTYNFFIVIILVPILATFGLVSNAINIFIFSKEPLRQQSGNVYLLSLACSDLLVVLTGMFLIWMDSARGYVRMLNSIFVDAFPSLTFGHIAQTCSVYYTVAAAFDCYVKVCWPKVARGMCTPSRACVVTVLITIACIAYNLVRFWQFQTEACFDAGQKRVRRVVCITGVYTVTANIYNVYMTAVVMTFLPFLLLSILNTAIMRRMKSKRTTKESGAVYDDPQLCTSTPDDDNIITMVMVVVLFLACNTLSLIANILENFPETDQRDIHYMSDMSSLLVMVNSSVNLIVYVRFEKDFRRLLLYHFCCMADLMRLGEGDSLRDRLGLALPAPSIRRNAHRNVCEVRGEDCSAPINSAYEFWQLDRKNSVESLFMGERNGYTTAV